MTDPIADMLTRIRNANQNHAKEVSMPSSKMKETIASILKDEGFITDFSIEKNDVQNILTLTLKYGKNKDKFLSVKPGITGYWAANGRSDTSYDERIEMELYYVDNISFKLDVKIFFKTISSVIKKEGAR